MTGKAYIVGTCDTKEADLRYVKDLVVKARPGATAVLVDISTRPVDCAADVSAHDVAMHHPAGPSAVFVSDRAVAVRNMGEALRRFLSTRSDIDGIIGLGGSGGTSMIGPAMQALPIGIPKVLVSTLASGDVAAYVGPSVVNMFHSVTDIAGLNRVSAKVLANAAHALVGMMTWRPPYRASDKKAVGLSMFGVTTPCVLSLTEKLHKHWDCLVFHATGTGGRSMEKLIDQGDISAVLDMTTTEICDLIVGGVLSAGEERLDSIARTGVPYVGSCGALDMVNFWARETVPRRFEGRLFHVHNAQVTLMRTTADESAKVG
ncbi:MAG: Tm-1-like ATP-binding domain-containing protein, partial [Alphaproteobacteria bacterium]